MATVWATFLLTGSALAGLALTAWLRRGPLAPLFRTVARHLAVLAGLTLLFPAGLPYLGILRWAIAYCGVVVILTAVMTISAFARARSLGA